MYLTVVNGLLGHFLMAYAHGHVTLLTISLLTLGDPGLVRGRSGRLASTSRSPPCRSPAWWSCSAALGDGVAWAPLGARPTCVDADLDAIGSLPSP